MISWITLNFICLDWILRNLIIKDYKKLILKNLIIKDLKN